MRSGNDRDSYLIQRKFTGTMAGPSTSSGQALLPVRAVPAGSYCTEKRIREASVE